MCAHPVILAPMAGISDLPFRNLALRCGATWVVSEMVASQEMVQAKPGIRERAELGVHVEDTVVQIAGRDAYWMQEAVRKLEANGARAIDINMGCPAKKVTNGASGSALMREPDLALRLIEAVLSATALPVSVKMRLGWDHQSLNAPQIAVSAEAAGVSRITVHGRTRQQFYKDHADWRAVAETKRAVGVPVTVNGDISSIGSAREALAQSGADAVMIGRAAQGQPWVFGQVRAALAGQDVPPAPDPGPLSDLVRAHYDAMLSFYGVALGQKVARKHLNAYCERANVPDALRREMLSDRRPHDVSRLIVSAFANSAPLESRAA